MTEDEARTKWCPFVRIVQLGDYWQASNGKEQIRGVDDDWRPLSRCIGSDCMAWRLPGQCGLAGRMTRRRAGSRILSSDASLACAMSKHDPPGWRQRRLDREQLKADVVRGLMGGLPLSVVARRHGTSQRTVSSWEHKDPAYAEEIASARALGWDSLAVEVLEIIDDKSEDVVFDKEGVPHFNTAAVLRAKAQCEMRLRLLACWDNGRYGPARTLKVEGELQTTTRHVIDPASLDDVGRAALRALLDQAAIQGLIPGPVDEAQDAEYEELSDPDEGA
jgi:hypothetical protein